jgi:hypothetical protein
MASAIVAALANVSDHPIGEEPPPKPATNSPVPAAAPPPSYDPFQPGLPPAPPDSRGGSFIGKVFSVLFNLCFFGFIFLAVAVFVLVQMGKAAQRRNRR